MTNFDEILAEAQPAFDKEAWAEKKMAERRAVYELADSTADVIRQDGEKFREYLDIQAKFDRYSVTNALLIQAQMPEATRLKSFDGWKETGASIRKNAKGISILEPGDEYRREDGSVGTSWQVKKVFDISATTAKKQAEPLPMDGRQLLKALIHKSPVPIQTAEKMPEGSGSYYDHDQQVIFVRKGMEASEVFCYLAKELSHAEIAMRAPGYNRKEADFQAYSASYLLCKKYGVDTRRYVFAALPSYIREQNPQAFRETLSGIRDTAAAISGRMYRALEPKQERGR